jgi:hypothetical protein
MMKSSFVRAESDTDTLLRTGAARVAALSRGEAQLAKLFFAHPAQAVVYATYYLYFSFLRAFVAVGWRQGNGSYCVLTSLMVQRVAGACVWCVV